MFSAGSFRFAQELDALADIRAHPALAVVKSQVPGYWQAAQGKANVGDDFLSPGDRFLSRAAYPEAWAAVAQGLALFGVTREFDLVVGGAESESYQDAMFRTAGERLIVEFPRGILSRLQGAELAAAVGHGLGHFLLEHDADPDVAALLSLARLEVMSGQGLGEQLWDDPACADLLMRAAALAQLQDLSADRIGLLVACDLPAVIRAIARSFLDVEATPQYFMQEDVGCLAPPDLTSGRSFRPHPAFPDRVRLLRLFAMSALYRQAIGLPGGLTADELAQYGRPHLLGQTGRADGQPDDLDELVLQLVLMDSLIAVGRCPRPRAESMILRYLTPGAYDRIIERYDELSDDDEDLNLSPWLQLAALEPSWWKVAMIERFLYLASLDRRLDDRALGDVATLAAAIGAREECRLIYTLGFGYDPFCWSASPLERSLRDRDAQQTLSQ